MYIGWHPRFISLDPEPGDEDDPITMNGYTYSDSNPVINRDLEGHWAVVKEASRSSAILKAGGVMKKTIDHEFIDRGKGKPFEIKRNRGL